MLQFDARERARQSCGSMFRRVRPWLAALAAGALALCALPAAAQAPLANATQVSAGTTHSCAIISGGGVKCWGNNSDGQIGDNTITDRLVATDATILSGTVSAIAAGGLYSCALIGGGVKCWGSNFSGQLGNGTNTDSMLAVDVIGLTTGVTAIAAGPATMCALTSAGAMECWGFNAYGQLGNNSIADSNTPVTPSGLTSGVTAVATGGFHSCAVVSGGAKCWGNNFNGQLGDNTTDDKLVPVNVVNLSSGVASIVVGNSHSCALTTAGGVKCWGYNFYGQLGDGSVVDERPVPGDVTGLTSGVVAITADGDYTCALLSGGGLKCWGNNVRGQLGDNSNTARFTPVDVVGLTSGVAQVDAGNSHACARLTGGGVRCWGYNNHGQLGDNSNSNSIAPVTTLAAGAGPSVPGAPVIGTATAGTLKATVTFTAPASDGGSAITGYTVTASPVAGTDSNAGSTSLSHVVTGLTAGVSYTFTVRATNAIGTGPPSAPSNAVVPTAGALTINPATVPGGTVGVAYATQNLSATPGVAPYTFAITSGAQPTGLNLSSAGVLSGTPTTVGTFNFTVTVTDSTPAGSGGPLTGVRSYSSTIAMGSQTINFAPLANRTFSATPFGVSATATSNLTVTFSSQTNSICQVSGTSVTMVAPGICTIRASQGGDANWNAAPNVDRSFTSTAGVLDIDINGHYDPFADGIIVMRYLFGLTGASLTQDAIGALPNRTDPTAISNYLNSILAQLDVDGDGTHDALTDGLLIVRYMLGMRGPALVTGATSVNATRNAGQIETYLGTLMP